MICDLRFAEDLPRICGSFRFEQVLKLWALWSTELWNIVDPQVPDATSSPFHAIYWGKTGCEELSFDDFFSDAIPIAYAIPIMVWWDMLRVKTKTATISRCEDIQLNHFAHLWEYRVFMSFHILCLSLSVVPFSNYSVCFPLFSIWAVFQQMPNLGSKAWAAAKSVGAQVMLRQVASKIDGTDATVTSPSSKGPKPLNLRDFFLGRLSSWHQLWVDLENSENTRRN